MSKHPPRKSEGPEPVGEILSRLFVARGWGRRQAQRQLEKAWELAAGPQFAEHTHVLGMRRNTLEIEVMNAVLLQELAGFHKRRILTELRKSLPDLTLTDLRFKAGS